MERKIINGVEYALEYINVQSYNIIIFGQILSQNPNFVQFESKRPMNENPYKVQYVYASAINEYFDDFRNIYSALNDYGISIQNFKKAFYSICNKHIQKVGRIIDADLYQYIDEIIIARYTIGEKIKDNSLKDFLPVEYWIELKKYGFETFKDSLFITKYKSIDPYNPDYEIIKYK